MRLGQGATVAAFACHPQVRAAVYGHRFVMDAEKESMEAAANGVAQWFFVRAAVTLRHGKMLELFEAVPDFTPLREVWTHHQTSRGSSVRSDAFCLASHVPDCCRRSRRPSA